MKLFVHIGRYFIMIQKIFEKFTKWPILKKLILTDIETLIVGSLGIVSFISFFVGGVVAIQTALNMENPLLPRNLMGFATRQSVILEFAPTFYICYHGRKKLAHTSLPVLEPCELQKQIDALEIMGINTYNYLIFPKIIALLFYPFVITIAMFLGIFGGIYLPAFMEAFSSSEEFIDGIQLDFIPFHVTYSFCQKHIYLHFF